HLDALEARFGKEIDDVDLLFRGDELRLDLEAVPRSHLANRDAIRQLHAVPLCRSNCITGAKLAHRRGRPAPNDFLTGRTESHAKIGTGRIFFATSHGHASPGGTHEDSGSARRSLLRVRVRRLCRLRSDADAPDRDLR